MQGEMGVLRPLGIGEIIDVAIKIYRKNFATLFAAVAVVVIPVQIFAGIVLVSAGTDNIAKVDPTTGTLPSGIFTAVAGGIVAAILSVVAAQLATGASFKCVSEAYLGHATDWRRSLDFALSRIKSLIWLAIIVGFLGGLAFLAFVIPGVYFFVAWSLSTPVLLFEALKPGEAMKRSRHLVKGFWGKVALVIIISAILQVIVSAVIGGLIGAIPLFGSAGAGKTMWDSLLQGLAQVLTTPFAAAVVAVLYFDLRVRKEGFDLELLANGITAQLPPATPGLPESGSPWDAP